MFCCFYVHGVIWTGIYMRVGAEKHHNLDIYLAKFITDRIVPFCDELLLLNIFYNTYDKSTEKGWQYFVTICPLLSPDTDLCCIGRYYYAYMVTITLVWSGTRDDNTG